MTFDDIRSFALGELGWSMERYRDSTVYEFNKASLGYWRNWERQSAWPSREIISWMISGNPYIKQHEKPGKQQIMKLSIDKEPERLDLDEVNDFENKIKYGVAK